MSCWLGGHAVQEARELFRQSSIASFETPEEAMQALAMLQSYERNQGN